MTTDIYGVDPNSEITSIMVRDAMVECFTIAHKDCLGIEADNETEKVMIKENVKKAFSETGGDFDAPTKESLINAAQYLKKFAQSFRDSSTIEQHFNEIKTLIEKIKED